MDCQIKRIGNAGRIAKVLAPNGKESILYKDILREVEDSSNEQREKLQDRFAPWVGRHIDNINEDRELALGLYKKTYSSNFLAAFSNAKKDENEETVITNLNNWVHNIGEYSNEKNTP